MNYFKKLILKWGKAIEKQAKKAEESQRVIQELKRKEWLDKVAEENRTICDLTKQIYDWYDELAKGFNIIEFYYSKTGRALDFGVNDLVILNHYGLRYDGSNGWDGGTYALINRGGSNSDSNSKPITCEITKIYVDKTYTYELIDKFFEQYSHDELIAWNNDIVECYRVWLERYNNKLGDLSIMDKYGLYVTATFDVIDFDFQPKWGLNIFSFLNIESDDGKVTLDAWQSIYETSENIKMLEEKKGELQQSIVEAKKKVLNQFN